jgi:hypothetical protein
MEGVMGANVDKQTPDQHALAYAETGPVMTKVGSCGNADGSLSGKSGIAQFV